MCELGKEKEWQNGQNKNKKFQIEETYLFIYKSPDRVCFDNIQHSVSADDSQPQQMALFVIFLYQVIGLFSISG